jgi:nudix-type nucleoside diphosphatase (YffH/AdpP family)
MAGTDRVRIVGEEVLSHHWGLLKRTILEYRRSDGKWQRQIRETYDRGPAAAVLLHCPERGTVILVRQFRFPLYAMGKNPFMLEVCAGLLDGDAPEACARREAREETGVEVGELRHAFDVEASPGSVIETIACFVGRYDAAARVGPGGGLAQEGEDIEVLELDFATALEMVERGEISDAKTILLLQWLALHPQERRKASP